MIEAKYRLSNAEKHKFRSWTKAKEILANRLGNGDIPPEDLIIFGAWHYISKRFADGRYTQEKYECLRNEFSDKHSERLENDKKFNSVMRQISEFMAQSVG